MYMLLAVGRLWSGRFFFVFLEAESGMPALQHSHGPVLDATVPHARDIAKSKGRAITAHVD